MFTESPITTWYVPEVLRVKNKQTSKQSLHLQHTEYGSKRYRSINTGKVIISLQLCEALS